MKENDMTEINIRKAEIHDLSCIIKLLADDPLGANREDITMPPSALYLKAWDEISKTTALPFLL